MANKYLISFALLVVLAGCGGNSSKPFSLQVTPTVSAQTPDPCIASGPNWGFLHDPKTNRIVIVAMAGVPASTCPWPAPSVHFGKPVNWPVGWDNFCLDTFRFQTKEPIASPSTSSLLVMEFQTLRNIDGTTHIGPVCYGPNQGAEPGVTKPDFPSLAVINNWSGQQNMVITLAGELR